MYTRIAPNVVRRNSDGASIPNDPNNADWKAYQAWLAAGNTPSVFIPAPKVIR